MHLVWLEGDSLDKTPEALSQYAKAMNAQSERIHVTLHHKHTGSIYWASIDHPDRWRHLARIWNANLERLEPTKYAIVVESDLIWQYDVPIDCLRALRQRHGDVICPLLLIDRSYGQFYDTHAFIRNGHRFTPFPPYVPGPMDDRRYVGVDTAGGMIVTTGTMLASAEWDEADCILKFPEGTKLLVDTRRRIYHPKV